MSRRTAERHPRRVEVRFWRRGQEQPHSGFTIDLSKTGLFLGTSMSLEPGERLRLEVVDRERGFLIEGQVARIHRVAVALRHVQQPGVGVRFLGPGELVGNFLNAGKAGGTSPQRRSSPTANQEPPATASEPAPPQASPPPAPPAPAFRSALARPAPDSLEDLFGPDPAAESAATAPPAEPEPAAAPASAASVPSARTVPVDFANRDGFLAVYGRDIAAGGLFVTTETPAPLHEVVLIELRPPIRADQRFCFEARVVHRFDAQSGGAKPGLTGMGVQFLDPDRVRAALAPIVAELGG